MVTGSDAMYKVSHEIVTDTSDAIVSTLLVELMRTNMPGVNLRSLYTTMWWPLLHSLVTRGSVPGTVSFHYSVKIS